MRRLARAPRVRACDDEHAHLATLKRARRDADGWVMTPTLSTAAGGMSRAFAQLEAAASRIASADHTASLPDAVIDLVEAKTAARANIAVLRSADELVGNLLDVLA